MIHDKYTISIDRLSLLLETKNPAYLLHYGWAPKTYLRRRFVGFMQDFHKMFSREEYNRMGATELIKTNLYNRHLMCRCFYDLFVIDRLNSELMAWHKEEFGTDKVDSTRLIKRLDFYQSKIKEYSKPQAAQQQQVKEVPFDWIVLSVEAMLGTHIDRHMKLYSFMHYYNQALEKSRNQPK